MKKDFCKAILFAFILILTFSTSKIALADAPTWILNQIDMLRNVGAIYNSTSSAASNINKLLDIGVISKSSTEADNIAILQAGRIISTSTLNTNEITALQSTGIISTSTATTLNSKYAATQAKNNPTSTSANPTTTVKACTTLIADVKYQDNGDAVFNLQNFLNKKGYLSVAPTGYFGGLTLSAVKAFQSANKISTTGYVGPLTRTAIQNIDCNYTNIGSGGTASKTPSIATPPIANKIDSFAPTINVEANPSQVEAGDSTTLKCSAVNAVDQCKITFKDPAGKTYSSIIEVSGAKSTGPIKVSTTYTIICYNKYGIPGSQSITVKMATLAQATNTQKFIQASTITSAKPITANRGDIISLIGSNFLTSNDVIFDGVKLDSKQITSQSSTSISFKIPEYKQCLSAYCPPPAANTNVETGGQKIIQVSNANGYSNDFVFTLPSKIITIIGAPQYSSTLAISSIYPISGNRGDTATIYGSGFSNDSIVLFGGFKVADNLIVSRTNTSISFIIPAFQIGCTNPDYEICPRLPIAGLGAIIETGGTKNVYVMNMLNKATTTSAVFTLPSKKITY